jgi:type II secretory pathway predicted ATPase ExeA
MSMTMPSLPAVVKPNVRTKAQLLALSPTERLASISDIFLYPSQVKSVLKALEFVFHFKSSAGLAQHILITGPHSTGKTALIRHFLARHPCGVEKPVALQPVVIATPTSCADAAALTEAILADGGWPKSQRGLGKKIPELQTEIFLRTSSTKMLILNRADRLAEGGDRLPHHCRTFIGNIIDRGAASLVLVGTSELAKYIDSCEELKDHFDVRAELLRMVNAHEWKKVCSELDGNLPFESTEISIDDMPDRLHVAASGALPSLMRLARSAAKYACFEKKALVLTREHFCVAFEQRRSGRLNPFRNIPLSAIASDQETATMSAHEYAIRLNNRPPQT